MMLTIPIITRIKWLAALNIAILVFFLCSCNKDDEIKYAKGYPDKMAGNWIIFEFPGAELSNDYRPPYYLVTALDPNHDSTLILDNLMNAGFRIKASIKGDTGFVAFKTARIEYSDQNDYAIDKITIDGYINDNYILKHYVLYPLAVSSFPNMSFTEEEMTEVIFYRAGYYNSSNEKIDTVMIMGYRMTGFENVNY